MVNAVGTLHFLCCISKKLLDYFSIYKYVSTNVTFSMLEL